MSKIKSPGRRAVLALLATVRGTHADQKMRWRKQRAARWTRGEHIRNVIAGGMLLRGEDPTEAVRLGAMNERHRERVAAWNAGA